ncbi:MAG: hypothetical protein ACLFST_01630 [Spirochaetia bacterium]
MPWKLIGFILILGIVVVFIGFNIENKSDISFGFAVLENVPIFISLFTAFLFGAVVALPFAVSKAKKIKASSRRKVKKKKDKEKVGEPVYPQETENEKTPKK